jgi:hypothetical protein
MDGYAMTTTTEIRRNVMTTGWALFREGRTMRDGRTFADCLRWAWAHVRREMAKAAFAAMQVVRLSPSLIRSPIARASSTERFGRRCDFKAAYMTARLGY